MAWARVSVRSRVRVSVRVNGYGLGTGLGLPDGLSITLDKFLIFKRQDCVQGATLLKATMYN